eukprot:3386815-Amphidinium_carterae.1
MRSLSKACHYPKASSTDSSSIQHSAQHRNIGGCGNILILGKWETDLNLCRKTIPVAQGCIANRACSYSPFVTLLRIK